jgi:hypothetical protein
VQVVVGIQVPQRHSHLLWDVETEEHVHGVLLHHVGEGVTVVSVGR